MIQMDMGKEVKTADVEKKYQDYKLNRKSSIPATVTKKS